MRILTDQLNMHIEKLTTKLEIPVIWWENVKNEGVGKLEYVKKKFASKLKKAKGNFAICIIKEFTLMKVKIHEREKK